MGKKKMGKMTFPESGLQIDKIRQAFRLIGMEGSAGSFDFLVEKIREEHGTMYDLLEELTRLEIAHKEDARIGRWLQQSKLTPIKTINGAESTRYNFKLQPSVDASQINELLSCRFIEDGQNVIFLGPPGVGKTHLAFGLGHEAILKGYEVKCMKLNEFIDSAKRAAETSIVRLHRSLVAPRLLILDDIDYYTMDNQSGKFLFDVIKQRYDDQTSTIITSNKNPREWNLFGTPERSAAALDRLFDNSRAVVVNIKNGKSHRVPQPYLNNEESNQESNQSIVRKVQAVLSR